MNDKKSCGSFMHVNTVQSVNKLGMAIAIKDVSGREYKEGSSGRTES